MMFNNIIKNKFYYIVSLGLFFILFCLLFGGKSWAISGAGSYFPDTSPAGQDPSYAIVQVTGSNVTNSKGVNNANTKMKARTTVANVYVPKSLEGQTISLTIVNGCNGTIRDNESSFGSTWFYINNMTNNTNLALRTTAYAGCASADKNIPISFVASSLDTTSSNYAKLRTYDNGVEYNIYQFVADGVMNESGSTKRYLNAFGLSAITTGTQVGISDVPIRCDKANYSMSCPTNRVYNGINGSWVYTSFYGPKPSSIMPNYSQQIKIRNSCSVAGAISFYDLDASDKTLTQTNMKIVLRKSNSPVDVVMLNGTTFNELPIAAIENWRPGITGVLRSHSSPGVSIGGNNDEYMDLPGGDPTFTPLANFPPNEDYTISVEQVDSDNAIQILADIDHCPAPPVDICTNIPGLQNVMPVGFSDPLGSKQCTKPDAAPKITFTPICDVANNRFYIIVDTSDPDGGTSTVSFSGTGIQPSPRSPQTSNSFIINRTNPEVAATLTASTDGIRPNYFRSPQKVSVGPVTFVPCVYSFSLTPFSSDPSLDDDEQPKIITSVNFSTTYASTSPSGVKGILDGQQTYLIKGGKKQPPIDQVILTKIFLASDNINRGPFNINSALVAGDMICTIHIVNHGKGFVDISGNITNYKLGPQLSSPASCVTIVNKPYLRTYGADVVAGGGFGGNCSSTVAEVKAYSKFVAPTGNVGSGSQLGVFASKDISGFLSMSLANAIGSGAVTNARSFANKTIAGNDLSGKFGLSNLFGGNFGTKFCSDDLWTDKGALKNATGAPINTFANGSYLSSARKLNVGPVGVSNKIAIYVNGDLQIDKDIVFANTANWGSINAIPSIYIVVLGNIYIDSSVTKLDGYYVAQPKKDGSGKEIAGTGRIYTCADNGKAPSSSFIVSSCNKKLTINGSFVAARVNFLRSNGTLRTAPLVGELSSSANIAESFEFSPELLLAVPAIAPINTTGTYDYMVSLPPAL